MAEQPNTQPQGVYVARQDVPEFFADSLGELSRFENGVFHVEFTSTVWDKPNPPKRPNGKRYPFARVAMPTNVAVELFNTLNGFLGALAAQGLVTQGPPPSRPPFSDRKN